MRLKVRSRGHLVDSRQSCEMLSSGVLVGLFSGRGLDAENPGTGEQDSSWGVLGLLEVRGGRRKRRRQRFPGELIEVLFGICASGANRSSSLRLKGRGTGRLKGMVGRKIGNIKSKTKVE